MSGREQQGRARPYHGAMTNATRFVRSGIALAVLALLGWLGGCAGDPISPPEEELPLHELVVSDTVAMGGAAAAAAAAAVARQSEDSGADHVTYVSLTPGTVPNGASATVRVVGAATPLYMPVRDGGFDPVLLTADVNDSIEVVVTDAGGLTAFTARAAVRPARPPIVVRTDPPKRKTDVPLNSAIIVVFSEPVAGGTVTAASIRVFRGNTVIPGAVTVLDGTGAVVAFVPNTPFAAHTEYRLEVAQAITDLDGEALQSGVTTTFTTGTASLGPPASIQVLPDSELRMSVGETYRATAVVRDAAGNQLIAEPVTWSVSPNNPDFGALTVSSTGLLEALGDGFANVIASVGGLSDPLYVFMRPQPAASIVVGPTPVTVAAGDTVVLTAIVHDAAGRLIKYPSLGWTSSDPAVATVTGGMVVGVSAGQVTVTAASGSASGTASVTVGPPRPVASVTLSAASATLIPEAMVGLSVTLRDANGQLISGRPITWHSDNEAVATVAPIGLVTGVSIGSANVTATSEGVGDTVTIVVTTITFASLSAGYEHTCGLTSAGLAYCWGANVYHQLGNTLPQHDLYPDDPDYGGQYFYNGSYVPEPVNDGLTFSKVSAGGVHTCGLATNGAAHCWGVNDGGQLGIGGYPTLEACSFDPYTADCSSHPLTVVGNLALSTVAVGEGDAFRPYVGHSCGLKASGAAYCWGNNTAGQLGTGTGALGSASPAAVAGGLVFADVSLGSTHTCGLTTNGEAYCWGDNSRGKLGGGPGGASSSAVPVAVSGGLAFVSLSVGAWHTCGLTSSGAAYCWGSNFYGQLGDGSTDTSAVPVPVTGGLTFTALSVGGFHTCGLTAGGSAYCWGINRYGELGIGSQTAPDQCATGTPFPYPCSTTPMAVLGAISFATLSAGGVHTCGLTTNGVAYCWGQAGPIGTGMREGSVGVPAKVAGQP
jgi:alpha-tubulin suppressor-like RCC1 family protein